MTTIPRRESAKIYAFPGRARAAAEVPRRGDQVAADHRGHRVPTVEFGSGWYHDAAVRDAQRDREPQR